MNAAKLEKSKRLQRVLDALKRNKKPQSTMQSINKAKVCAVNSIISELRRNGYNILCQRVNRIYYYSLV